MSTQLRNTTKLVVGGHITVDGYLVTAPAFTGGDLIFEGTTTCPLAWLSSGEVNNVALSADACDADLYGWPYPPGRSIALKASFEPPPGAVAVSASGLAECDAYGSFGADATVGAGNGTATFVWPAGVVTADTACKMTVTVTFTSPGSSAPDSVSASLPVSFRFHPPTARTVFDSIPTAVPPNVPSQPFQAQQTLEFGDYVQLDGTARYPAFATVLMSTWARNSDWPSMDAGGWDHPITLNVYNVDLSGSPPALGTKIGSVTQVMHVPWRPESDSTCPDTGYGAGFAWRAGDGKCYNGYAFTIGFDLRGIAALLPSDVIIGIAYDTNSWGYHPIGIPGPYESLNVGTANVAGAGVPPSVGIDVEPAAVFWNTMTAGWYGDGGAGGFGTFRWDFNPDPERTWLGYEPAVRIYAY